MASNLAAVLPTAKSPVSIQSRPIPTPGPGQLLIRNHAIAANPVDWKIQAYDFFVTKYPNILGSDVSGIVEAVGLNVTSFQKGDRVCGFAMVIADSNIDEGAFQSYTILREEATVKIPEGMSFEEGSLYPMGAATAFSGLFDVGGLEMPDAKGGKKGYEGKGIVIWGASSSVGVMAVQIAKDIGFTVFATASAKHHEYLKGLGADELVDYKDADVVVKLVGKVEERGVPLVFGFDAISEGETSFVTAEILAKGSKGKGGKMAFTLPIPEGKKVAEGVEPVSCLAYGIFQGGKEKMGRFLFNEYLANAMARGALKPAPRIEVVEGGIAATQKCWDQLKEGVSGKKLVIKVE
ncbi:hypothetical protein MMC10_002783 [Thelotrema lepadinum]|nr:hypothetical protein [Thelotrema lepadinum]